MKGLPRVVLTDCGRDYESKLLEDPCVTYNTDGWDEPFLNRRFSGLGVLRALNLEIVHSLPFHPQSKSVERVFGTIERTYISKLPGWCHCSVEERPPGFAQKLDKMLENRELLWADDFVKIFAEEILPAYHGTPSVPEAHPDLPDWLLSYESMSPAQRYQALERVKTAIPDWMTMSILKKHYYPEKATVSHYGVRFQNVYYKDEALAGIVGKKVSILCHSFTPPYAPASITVIHNGKAICEAYPVRKNSYTDESAQNLAEASDTQNQPVKEMGKVVSRIGRSADSILPDGFAKPVPTEQDQMRDFSFGQVPLEADGSRMDSSKDTKNDGSDSELDSVLTDALNLADGDPETDIPFHADQDSYDEAYTLIFGSME